MYKTITIIIKTIMIFVIRFNIFLAFTFQRCYALVYTYIILMFLSAHVLALQLLPQFTSPDNNRALHVIIISNHMAVLVRDINILCDRPESVSLEMFPYAHIPRPPLHRNIHFMHWESVRNHDICTYYTQCHIVAYVQCVCFDFSDMTNG